MTIKDLSRQTGYSVGTISRVLNNQPNVSEKARDIILKAAAECNFQLNSNAKQLKQQHGTSLVVISKGISNELFSRMVEALQARVAQTSYPLVVEYIDENDNEVHRALQLCREKKPLGLLFLGGNRRNFQEDFDKINVPSVLVTNNAEGLPFANLSSVSSDDALAAQMAIDHLVSLGHRKIAVLGGNRETSEITELRYQGCCKAFLSHGIVFDEARDYISARFSFADGYRAAKDLLKQGRQFTALFAMSDVMAIGAIRALRDAGLRVPEDVSVMGFDGLDLGEYTIPRLASVCQNVDALAHESLNLLLQYIEQNAPSQHKTISVYSEWRESTRKID